MFGRKIGPMPIFLAAVLVLAALVGPAAAFTIDGYEFAGGTEHTISNAGADLTYYQVAFTLNNSTGTSTGSTVFTDGTTGADWRDIRFANATGTVYPHWIESTTATTAFAWVNISSIPAGSSAIRIYYDSDTAVDASSITATFPFADHFTGAAIDSAKWTVSAAPSVSGSVCTVASSQWIQGKTSFGMGYATRWLATLRYSDTGHYVGISDSGGEAELAKHDSISTAVVCYGSGSSYGNSAHGKTIINNYHVLEVARDTGHVVYNIDNELVRDETTIVSSAARYPASRVWTNTVSADWIVVRKYNATAPAHGSYTVMVGPDAEMSANVTSGDPPLAVAFTDQSTNTPTSWDWDFGDGSDHSPDQNPTHTYTAEGVYSVSLTATNEYGSNAVTQIDYITVENSYVVPVADFFFDTVSGYPPFSVSTLIYSTGPPTAYAWDFDGDGSIDSTDPNATYEYTAPGTYTVILNVSNPAGFDLVTKTNYITVVPLPASPVASFTADAIAGHAPLLVSFTDTSTGSPTAWAWDFDGDAVADSTDQNPTHEYAADGNYTVTLQASNAGGTDLESKPEYVSVGPLTATYLKASFRFAVVGGSGGGGVTPLTVAFTDTTRTNNTGTYTRYWSFGDGQTSVEANPTHVYTTAGKYDVRLTVESDTRRSTESYAKVIQAYPVAAASLLPTNTYGAKMTQMMDSNWNLSVIGPLLPTPYTDLVPETLFWGLLWGGVFMIYFVRQGTSWLTALLGIIIGGNVLAFLPPEWAAAGQALLIVSVGAFFYVLIQGRIRSS